MPRGWAVRKWRMTREGKVFVAMACMVGLAAVNTGNNLVYLVFGFMLTLMLLSGVLSELVLQGMGAKRLLPTHCYAEKTLLVQVEVFNKKRWLHSYSIEVEELGAVSQIYLPKIAPRGAERAAYQVTFLHRGYCRFEGFWLKTRFPFGLVEKSKFVQNQEDYLIFPNPIPPRFIPERSYELGDTQEQQRKGSGNEVFGLREYVSGDEANRIHWRRSASLGQLVVRERQQSKQKQLLFVLDPLEPEHDASVWAEQFERSVSEATGLVMSGISQGQSVCLSIRGDKNYWANPTSGTEAILTLLATIEAKQARDGIKLPEKPTGLS
ncbi:MAG: DUF58 domain-containing protein [Myxococcales bacterium]|nr:MAG: DUF58 domain-containing protein [Myxococcales bacterium]